MQSDTPVKIVKRNEIHGESNGITQKENSRGGIERNYYDGNGNQIKQVSNNNHGNPKKHPYGKNGEHTHEYIYDENGNLIGRPMRELTMKSERRMKIYYEIIRFEKQNSFSFGIYRF